MLKKEINELDAIIMTIKVLDIQKGPYKSGSSLTTSLKAGFNKIADFTRSQSSSS